MSGYAITVTQSKNKHDNKDKMHYNIKAGVILKFLVRYSKSHFLD